MSGFAGSVRAGGRQSRQRPSRQTFQNSAKSLLKMSVVSPLGKRWFLTYFKNSNTKSAPVALTFDCHFQSMQTTLLKIWSNFPLTNDIFSYITKTKKLSQGTDLNDVTFCQNHPPQVKISLLALSSISPVRSLSITAIPLKKGPLNKKGPPICPKSVLRGGLSY